MATYYVRKTGSDGANGQTPATAWLTFGKALGASGIASGDTVYIGAGTYRETVSVGFTPSVTTSVIGDVDGSKTGDAGEVILTAYTTNDTSAPSASATFSFNGKPFLALSKLTLISGSAAAAADLNTVGSHDCSLTDCTIITNNANAVRATTSAGVAFNLTVDRCRIVNVASTIPVTLTLNRHTADYDTGIVIRNCLIWATGTDAIRIASTGAGVGFGGNIQLSYSTLYSGSAGMRANDASLSTTLPAIATGCVFLGNTGLAANTSGQITETYCSFHVTTARTNVTAGTGSQTAYAPLFQVGQEIVVGGRRRPFLEPATGSGDLNFSAAASPPAVDLNNNPRPSGGAGPNPAAGALGRGNTFGKETGTVRTGSNALSATGPAYQDFQLPVAATATTVSIYARYDSTYAGTKPSMSVLNGGEAGVADATATQAGSANAWEQLTLSFTPTSAGIVTIRLRSQDTNGGGKAFFDDFSVS